MFLSATGEKYVDSSAQLEAMQLYCSQSTSRSGTVKEFGAVRCARCLHHNLLYLLLLATMSVFPRKMLST